MDDFKESNERNGFYRFSIQKLSEEEKNVMLSVYPPIGGGSVVSLKDEKGNMESYLPEDTDWEAVKRAFGVRSGEPEVIARIRESINIPGLAFAGISEDEMSAYILFTSPEGEAPSVTYEQFMAKLENHGVIFGIDHGLIKSIIEKGEAGRAYIVAEGTPAVKGDDARIDYKVKIGARTVGPKILEDGSVDLKSIMEIDSVVPGQIIAKKIMPTEGIDGTTVTGSALKAEEGADLELRYGRGVNICQTDPFALEAMVEGEVSVNKSGLIEIREVFQVKGNVSYATGNIQFSGNVAVNGDVTAGFSVKATGDIRVEGTVEAAELDAGGDVSIKGGFLGHEKGTIRCKGKLTASFIQNGKVIAEDDIVIEKGILNSEIICGGSVLVSAKNAAIIGGQIISEHDVRSGIIGSEANAPTVIRVGVSRELLDELQQLNMRLNENKKKRDEAGKGYRALEKIEKSTGLDQKRTEIKNKLIEALKQLSVAIDEDEKRMNELNDMVFKSKRAKVIATNQIYPGVHLFFAVSAMKVKDPLHRVAVYEHKGEATFSPLTE